MGKWLDLLKSDSPLKDATKPTKLEIDSIVGFVAPYHGGNEKSSHFAQVETEVGLSDDDAQMVLAWLDRIDETDPEMIERIFDDCSNDLVARQMYLEMAQTLDEPAPSLLNGCVSCGLCVYFKRTGRGHLGHCTQGQPEAISGIWAMDERQCLHFLPKQVDQKIDGVEGDS